MSKNTRKRILVAPLDWGLGHTTRCVPLISALQALGHTVVVAGNDAQLSFIENIYAGIELVPLQGYDITYSHKDDPGAGSLAALIPRMYKSIKEEHRWLAGNKERLGIDGIISDNRYGLYHKDIPSVIITHQLQVQTGLGRLANRVVQKMHYNYLSHFGQVWVPDIADAGGLAGALSHPAHLPPITHYIGWLSQFWGQQLPMATADHLLILLSGPEPQRTMLHRKLWDMVKEYPGKVVFVAGRADVAEDVVPPHVTYYSRLGGVQLARLIIGASAVICRSGYSTIMDLALLGKPALLIPTPGQTEQEYLAKYLSTGDGFSYCVQSHLSPDVLKGIDITSPALSPGNFALHREVLKEWCASLP